MLNVTPKELSSVGGSTWSRDALGRRALFDLLNQLGIRARRDQVDEAFSESSTHFIIQNAIQEAKSHERQSLAFTNVSARLYVLPKRNDSNASTSQSYTQRELDLIDNDALIVRLKPDNSRLQNQRTNHLTALTSDSRDAQTYPTLAEPQLISSDHMTPIVAFGDLILVGEIQSNKPRTWVLSDPDILDNHGLDDGDNAVFAVQLIKNLQNLTNTQGKEITFIERIVNADSTPSFFQILLRFPYSLISVAFIFLCAILGWLSLARFGAAAPTSPPVGIGRRALVDTATQLVSGRDNQVYILERYLNNVVRDVAKAMKLPNKIDEEPDADSPALIEIEKARAVSPLINEIKSDVDDLSQTGSPRTRDLIVIARRLHNWKKEMLDES